jgi:hypothetical protein
MSIEKTGERPNLIAPPYEVNIFQLFSLACAFVVLYNMESFCVALCKMTLNFICSMAKGHVSELSVKVGTLYGPGKVAVLTHETFVITEIQ